MKTTSNYKLKKPDGIDPVEIQDFNDNADIMDAELAKRAGKATATTGADGLMAAADKVKLNGIAASANNYTHPANHPPSIISQDSNNKFVTDAEKNTWNGKASTAIATTSANGLMAAADKVKLNGISNYTHPANHPPSIILQDANNRLVTDAEKNTWNGKVSAASPVFSGSISLGRKAGSVVGENSFAVGLNTVASGLHSHAEGMYTVASGEYSHAEGCNNSALFTTAYGVGSHAEGGATEAIGNYSHTEGYMTRTTNFHSHAEGWRTAARGAASHSEGYDTEAIGDYSHSEGFSTRASGTYSHTEGCANSNMGNYAHVGGNGCLNYENGHSNFIHGVGLLNGGAAGITIIGTKNNVSTITDFNNGYASESSGGGTLFVIGSGTSGGDGRREENAFRVDRGGVYASRNYIASGADYAEYYEWEDGNTDDEDRRGLFVTTNKRKVRIAEPGEYIEGVVSATPCIIGNGDEDWQGRYVTDVFGNKTYEEVEVDITEWGNAETGEFRTEHITETIEGENGTTLVTKEIQVPITIYKEIPTGEKMISEIPVQNPLYDSTKHYDSRKTRKEWVTIGMLGQIVMVDDGTCIENGFCKPSVGGIATKANTHNGYRVYERLDNNHIRIKMEPSLRVFD